LKTLPVERLLDVRDLEPCEPLERALEATTGLGPGEFLHMLHRREPFLLYPILAKRDFCWQTVRVDEERYDVYVWRIADEVARRAVDSEQRGARRG
jgi:hypothetical protein